MALYKVLRRHDGDKEYFPGDTREAEFADVAHLMGKVLEDPDLEKVETELKNKVARKARNKAEG